MQSKLALGPMSTHAVEAVFGYSSKNSTPMMLIPSRNQVDKSGGYVNGWNTRSFSSHSSGSIFMRAFFLTIARHPSTLSILALS